MPLFEPADMTAIDLDQIVGMWYAELDAGLGCIVMLYTDPHGRPQLVSAVSDWKTPADHHPVWVRSPMPIRDEHDGIRFARRSHSVIMKIGQPKGWELLRGGRTGDELLEELARMPGVQVVREHLNG